MLVGGCAFNDFLRTFSFDEVLYMVMWQLNLLSKTRESECPVVGNESVINILTINGVGCAQMNTHFLIKHLVPVRFQYPDSYFLKSITSKYLKSGW